MTSEIRLVATDLDGTLLRSDTTVSRRTHAALGAAHEAGLLVVILTARSWRSLAALDIPQGIVACSNGAVIYDIASETVVHSYPFEAGVLAGFFERVQATADVAMAWETATKGYRTPRFHELAEIDGTTPQSYLRHVEIADALADDHVVTKVLVRHETMTPDELAALLAPVAGDVTLTTSGGRFVEIMAAGVTKAFALERLCQEHGVAAEEVVAVGDHANDLPMLRWAGRGVAMANAHPVVLAEISEVTASNDDDGLALVIEGLLA